MDPIVEFENVGVSLGGRRILAGIDLKLAPGGRVGIVGPNGSGKTTLVRTAATLLSIDSGRAVVLGLGAESGDLSRARSAIGLIGHQPALIPELTLIENLTHVARLAAIDTGRIQHALEVVGLSEAADRRASACSFGMRRRIEIAHLLLTKPRLLLLDEAAAGLDASARQLIAALVRSVGDRGGGTIVVSHDLNQLDSLCDHVLTLSSGRLEEAR